MADLQVEMYIERTRARLAYSSLVSAFIVLLALIFAPIPESGRPIANTLGPVYITTCLAFYGYYFAASSKDKKTTENSTTNVADTITQTENPPVT
jgi:hypothetical protein